MGKAERKQIAFFLVCVILLGIFGNLLVALAESRDGSGVGDDSEVMMDVGVTSSSVAEATTSSAIPTENPAVSATSTATPPTVSPTSTPMVSPMSPPTVSPTSTPTVSPMSPPTVSPTSTPMVSPTSTPTVSPTSTPTSTPMVSPTETPTETSTPPTQKPSATPNIPPTPSILPVPTISPGPPAGMPTEPSITAPTVEPTAEPSADPVKKNVTIPLGKSLSFTKLFNEKSAVEKLDKVTLKNPGKYNKYFQINRKKGKIITKINYAVNIKKTIRVHVTLKGIKKSYPVDVKLTIPKPKVTIHTKKYIYFGERGYDFVFRYNIPKAKKIQVRLAKGGSKEINRYLDKYISGRKSNQSTHIRFTKSYFKKVKKITFRIVAYYGKAKNKSEVLEIIKTVK